MGTARVASLWRSGAERADCLAVLGPAAASRNSLRALRALRSDNRGQNDHEARCARRPPGCAPRRPRDRPRRCAPATTLGLWYSAFRATTPAHHKPGGTGAWGQRAARLCGAEEHRACGQREARSWSCSSRLSERRERSERSEFGDAGARPSTARQSARSAPDRHSEAPRAVPTGLCRPTATAHRTHRRSPTHCRSRNGDDRFGPTAGLDERRVTGTQPHAIGPPHCGYWWASLYAALLTTKCCCCLITSAQSWSHQVGPPA